MDDADDGRRGLRARAGPQLLAALREHYGLDGDAEADLGGSSSLNLMVTGGGRRYVVRVHRPHVTPERLGDIHKARAALLASGVPCAPAVPTLQGEPWAGLGARLLEVEAYVDHDAVMDSWERLEAGMPLLAKAHNALGALDLGEAGRRPRFASHLEPADVLTGTRRGTTRIRGWGPTAEEAGATTAADRLAKLLAEAEAEAEAEAGLVSRLPRQLVHGDFWDDNLEMPLSAAERAALPLAMARHPLSSIAGWVAHLDDEAAARRHATAVATELRAALATPADLDAWRDAFA